MTSKETLREFKKITGQNVEQYFNDLSLFLKRDYPSILQYYTGDVAHIDRASFDKFFELEERCAKIMEVYSLNKERFGQVKWFLLLEAVEESYHSLKSIKSINRWGRTSVSKFGNSSFKTIEYILKSHQTLENVSRTIVNDSDPSNDWYKIAYDNQLTEDQYDLNGGFTLRLNLTQINDIFNISSIVDVITPETVKGKDIDKNFSFENDDIRVIEGDDQLKQSIDLLINLKKNGNADAPELGLQKEMVIGGNRALFNFPIINRQLKETFESDDSLKGFQVTNYSMDQDNVIVDYIIYNRTNDVVNDTQRL